AAGAVVADRLAPLVAEIRGSLEFYSIQPGALPLGRVVLTGGWSQTPGLLESLSDQLAVPVTRGRLSDRIEVADQAVSPARREMAEPLMAVAVGLALAGLPDGGGRRITLLPPVAAERRRARAEALAVAGAVVAVAAVLVGAWVVRGRQVVDQRQAAAQSQAQVTVLRHQVGSYAGVTRIDAEAAAGAKRIEGVLGRDVAWTTLLSGLAGHMPADTWLTSFQGTAPTGTTPGKVSLAGSGLAQTSTAHWLQDESALPSLTELWVSSSTKGSGKGPVTFSATADLTPRAYSRRAQAYLGGTGGTGR
ncbi:MAG: pilus assembly protein PilM, partial [Acidimicrobiales bacterium]